MWKIKIYNQEASGVSIEYLFYQIKYTSLISYRYNLDFVASFDTVITAKHISVVEDQPVTETESQEENIGFKGENDGQIERGGGGEDRTSSPALSMVQYRLPLGLDAQPNTNKLKEDNTQL